MSSTMESLRTSVLEVPELTDVIAISVHGHVSYRNASELRQALLREIAKSWASRVVIELGSVRKMDTAGAAVLVEALMLGRKRGKQMLLCTPSESVMRTFRLAGLEDVLEACCPNPDETRRRLMA
jgi:anti-anti-sigma factor